MDHDNDKALNFLRHRWIRKIHELELPPLISSFPTISVIATNWTISS